MKDWDLPLLNQSKTISLGLEYFQFEAEQIVKSQMAFEAQRRVAELRRSCGVKSELATVNIRRPPRYMDTFK